MKSKQLHHLYLDLQLFLEVRNHRIQPRSEALFVYRQNYQADVEEINSVWSIMQNAYNFPGNRERLLDELRLTNRSEM